MSKMITLTVTIRDDAEPANYIAMLMPDMQELSQRGSVEAVSLSCHTLDEEGKIKDGVFAATPDPIRL